MGEILWLEPTGGGELPPSSVFFASGRFVLSTFVIGCKDVFRRRNAYERCAKVLADRARTLATGDIRVKHSHLSAELIGTKYPPYSFANPPRDLSLAASFPDIIAEQEALHGPLEEPDRIKLVSQAVYGGGHLLTNLKTAWDMLVVEWQSLERAGTEPLAERISPEADVYRINLRAAKELGLNLEETFDALKRSAELVSADIARREIQLASQASSLGIKPERILPHPPHHSTPYRQRVKPAYRLIHASLITELLPETD